MAKKKANTKKGIIPHPSKKPRTDPKIQDPLNQRPAWQVGIIDVEGPFGWTSVNKKLLLNELLPKIKNFESMFWKDILGRNNHEISVSKISRDAQKRLSQLNHDDTEFLISLRLSGEKRVWGIRISNIFKILWWDPKHQVYPSKLKHT